MIKTLFSLLVSAFALASLNAAPQAVVFDWGNVISFDDRSVVVDFMCRTFGFSKSDFERANVEKRKAMEAGKSDIDFWLQFAKENGIKLPDDWAHIYTSVLKASVGADPKMYELIEELKHNQIRVGLLSNINDRYTKLIRDFGFYDPFDPCLLSCEIGLDKPDPKAYEFLLSKLNIPAEEVVFIDDKLENIEAAKKMGIDAILFESAPQIRRELEKRELLQDTQQQKVERRAAFDIGSGQIKMQISDVDLRTNKIVNVLFTDSAYVGLRENLVKSLDGRLSSDIQNKTVEAISELIKKAALFHPEAYHAVATEALRLAKNADTLVERIEKETGTPVTIVSQEEEGILGFISAVSEANVDLDKVVSWDLGGGSFQITTKCGDYYSVYLGSLGKTPMKNALLKIQGKDVDPMFSPNPISKSQANQAIQFVKDNIKDIPIELRQKLNDPNVVVLGVGINPLWGMEQSTHFDNNRVLKELNCRLNLDDTAIRIKDSIPANRKEASTHVVSNLILAYGVMEALDITHVHYVGTQGANAIGALLSPKYWKNSNELSQKP